MESSAGSSAEAYREYERRIEESKRRHNQECSDALRMLRDAVITVDGNEAHTLGEALQALRIEAGAPSYKAIGRAIGMSHASVFKACTGGSFPQLKNLLRIVEYLGGDVAAFKRLWIEAKTSAMKQPNQDARPLNAWLSREQVTALSNGHALRFNNPNGTVLTLRLLDGDDEP